jgi:hypothetical protein
MSDVEELLPLSQFDEVEALTVGSGDHDARAVGPKTEIILNLILGGRVQRVEMTRHDAELIIAALHEVLHPHTHKSSPVTRIWEKLDETMDYLMEDDDPEPEDVATARAYATAIAFIRQPLAEAPDIVAVREEAVERWDARP